jgi:hypothetical protein
MSLHVLYPAMAMVVTIDDEQSEEERRFFADRFETIPSLSSVEKRNILSSLGNDMRVPH